MRPPTYTVHADRDRVCYVWSGVSEEKLTQLGHLAGLPAEWRAGDPFELPHPWRHVPLEKVVEVLGQPRYAVPFDSDTIDDWKRARSGHYVGP